MVNMIEEYLNNFTNFSKDNLSLDAMRFFMKEYNNFEKDMKFIHVAGTNGKGSVTEMISNILEYNGYKVGKYISPHLIKYNERISINKKEISDEEFINLIEEMKPKIQQYKKIKNIDVTLFELLTIIALLYFYRNKVDFVVLETGLGGLFDCTNIISNPLVSIITSIGYDHMHILGNNLNEIAYQKAGIIKENSNTVIFNQNEEINNVFIDECKRKNNKLHMLEKESIKNSHYDNNFQYFDYKDYKNIKINLKGKKQFENAAICIESVKILNNLGYKIEEKSVREGLSTVIHRARMEKINDNPLIIYDGAHNLPAIENLRDSIDMYYKNFNKLYVVSILERKDYRKMLEKLLEDKDSIFIFTSGNDDEKYASKEELYKIAIEYRKDNKNLLKMELKDSIKYIMDQKENRVNFVIGSFYTYGVTIKEIKNYLH